MEEAVAAEGEGVIWIAAFGGGEEGEVPIFGDVPVVGVEGVDERGEDPVSPPDC